LIKALQEWLNWSLLKTKVDGVNDVLFENNFVSLKIPFYFIFFHVMPCLSK